MDCKNFIVVVAGFTVILALAMPPLAAFHLGQGYILVKEAMGTGEMSSHTGVLTFLVMTGMSGMKVWGAIGFLKLFKKLFA